MGLDQSLHSFGDFGAQQLELRLYILKFLHYSVT